ncbi:unnamed protein product [Brachionus calyciflorus]|uniref:Uncharacterized protein n=1 Tax=Brachionus calyciflorus TaxID=104777 RepID=A0A813N735_9BILA|nr:unnamed protein product [Brachionus calyciflorus]
MLDTFDTERIELGDKSKFESITTNLNFSQYPNFMINDLKDMSFLLSIFDNIVGPKIIHYWKIETKDKNEQFEIDDDLLKYISVHTLNGELYQDKMMGQIKYRLYLIKEVNCAIFSVFFDACTYEACNYNTFFNNQKNNLDGDSTNEDKNNTQKNQALNNCLSVILPFNKSHIFLGDNEDHTQLFVNIFENLVMEFKIMAHIKPKINKVSAAIEDMTRMILNLCENILTLEKRGLDRSIKENTSIENKTRISIKETLLNDLSFTGTNYSHVNNEFLIKAISSHLITSFNTIVVGKTSAGVNKMINTLALFMPNEKLRTSCYALEEYSLMSPYFTLQGLVLENPEEFNLLLDADFLFKRNFPTTIVDVSSKTVCRTCIFKEFVKKKEEYMNKRNQFLFNCLNVNDLNNIYPVANMMTWISNSSQSHRSVIIANILKQLDVFESGLGIKQTFIDLAIKDLYLISLNLIEYVNNEGMNMINRKEKILKISSKKVCKDLLLSNEEDLNVAIAYANFLKPDFLQSIHFF